MATPSEFIAALFADDPLYLADAREGQRVGNTIAGGLLALEFKLPRARAEEMVARVATKSAAAGGPDHA